MTLVEFIAPLRNSSNQAKCLAILYFQHRYAHADSLTVEDIRQCLRNARVQKFSRINVADVLAKSGHYVDSPGSKGNRRLWKLTSSGMQQVRNWLKLPQAEPEIEHDISTLAGITGKVTNHDVRAYLDEAIMCLQIGALRASVVFLWTGAIRVLQQDILSSHGSSKINSALQKHDQKARNVSKVDDFAYIKDKITLLAAQELGVLDKGQRETLEEALNLRNRCGHPTRYRPGVKKVSSFVEDVIGIVFV
jgi:hypothetical protein